MNDSTHSSYDRPIHWHELKGVQDSPCQGPEWQQRDTSVPEKPLLFLFTAFSGKKKRDDWG